MGPDTGASAAFLGLYQAGQSELRRLMAEGTQPDPAALAGREFRGANIGPVARPLGIRRFVKGFQADGRSGYNVRVTGSDLDQAWLTALWRGNREFGFFSVDPVDASSPNVRHPRALLLDYGACGSGPSPERLLRDYLVQVSPDLLLGHAFMAVLGRQLPVGYFVLEPLPWS